ncbi:MAG: hypothetical protein ACO1PB_08390 [Ramlibacter sp.]
MAQGERISGGIPEARHGDRATAIIIVLMEDAQVVARYYSLISVRVRIPYLSSNTASATPWCRPRRRRRS